MHYARPVEMVYGVLLRKKEKLARKKKIVMTLEMELFAALRGILETRFVAFIVRVVMYR